MTQATFAGGCIPFSEEGIRSQIVLAKREYAQYAYPILKAAEPDLDRLTLELCADLRSRGERLEDWLLRAERDAIARGVPA